MPSIEEITCKIDSRKCEISLFGFKTHTIKIIVVVSCISCLFQVIETCFSYFQHYLDSWGFVSICNWHLMMAIVP
jgi:hypothetical protein